jgi:AcrR family transcriptional regulator
MAEPVNIRFDDSSKLAVRRDAHQRRRRIVDVAVKLYRTEGLGFSMHHLATCAEVGRATLYRHFPDQTAVLIAVLERHLEVFAAQLKKWRDRDDAFMLGIRFLADRATASRGFGYVAALDKQSPGVARWASGVMQELLAEPLERAMAAGLIRRDFPLSDHGLLVLMIAGVKFGSRGEEAAARIERAIALLAQALSPRL